MLTEATEHSGSPEWLRRLPLLLWLTLAAALGAKAWIEPEQHSTYPCFEAGPRCWWADLTLYDPRITGQDYRYSPTFAVLFTPLAMLPRQVGGMLWSWLNVAVFAWAMGQLVPRVLPGRWSPKEIAAFHGLVMLAAIRGFWAGQTNTLIIALVAAGAAAVVGRRWWAAAFLLMAPAFIKVWPVAAAFLFVACWPRELGRRMLVAAAVLAWIPFATRPNVVVFGHYIDFFAALTGPMQSRHVYRDAWTVWELVHPPVWPAGYRFLQLAVAGIVLGLCLWHRHVIARDRHDRPRLAGCRTAAESSGARMVLGLWCVWQLLFGPGVERNTLSLIAPLTAWAVVASHDAGRGTALARAAFGLTVAFSFGALERMLAIPAALGALPAGVACFGVWLLKYGRNASSPSPSGIVSDKALSRLAA